MTGSSHCACGNPISVNPKARRRRIFCGACRRKRRNRRENESYHLSRRRKKRNPHSNPMKWLGRDFVELALSGKLRHPRGAGKQINLDV
jgi:hypothetical protein